MVEVGEFVESDGKCVGKGILLVKNSHEGSQARIVQDGYLHQAKGMMSVISRMKFYVPAINDPVIGVVTSVCSNYYTIDINDRTIGMSYIMLFNINLATKQNRPNLVPGDLIFARILEAKPGMTTQLIANDTGLRKYGRLVGGAMASVCALTSYYLLQPNCPLLEAMGRICRFEILIGQNCRIWLSTRQPTLTMYLLRLFESISRSASIDIDTLTIPENILNAIISDLKKLLLGFG